MPRTCNVLALLVGLSGTLVVGLDVAEAQTHEEMVEAEKLRILIELDAAERARRQSSARRQAEAEFYGLDGRGGRFISDGCSCGGDGCVAGCGGGSILILLVITVLGIANKL